MFKQVSSKQDCTIEENVEEYLKDKDKSDGANDEGNKGWILLVGAKEQISIQQNKLKGNLD